ncbi:hypothetical protein CISIN_1g0406501mg, partial [Citrus sinensis]
VKILMLRMLYPVSYQRLST